MNKNSDHITVMNVISKLTDHQQIHTENNFHLVKHIKVQIIYIKSNHAQCNLNNHSNILGICGLCESNTHKIFALENNLRLQIEKE